MSNRRSRGIIVLRFNNRETDAFALLKTRVNKTKLDNVCRCFSIDHLVTPAARRRMSLEKTAILIINQPFTFSVLRDNQSARLAFDTNAIHQHVRQGRGSEGGGNRGGGGGHAGYLTIIDSQRGA